jgi:hypothetical protein
LRHLIDARASRSSAQEIHLAAIDADSNRTPFVCNLGVMNAEERAVYIALSRKLISAGEERRELADGYAFKLATTKISLLEIGQWMTFERRCCPFFNLQIEAEPNDGPVWLRMTGAAGIKEFIRSEIGS